jgi:hypothetical protein
VPAQKKNFTDASNTFVTGVDAGGGLKQKIEFSDQDVLMI